MATLMETYMILMSYLTHHHKSSEDLLLSTLSPLVWLSFSNIPSLRICNQYCNPW